MAFIRKIGRELSADFKIFFKTKADIEHLAILGQNHVIFILTELNGVTSLFFRKQYLMDLLPRTDADDMALCSGRQYVEQLGELHAGYLRHKNLSAFHVLESEQDQLEALLEIDPKTRHFLMSDMDGVQFFSFDYLFDDAASTAHDIAVSYRAEFYPIAGIRIGAHE